MRFLCTADWHLPPRPGAPGWGGLPECGDDVWRLVDAVYDLAARLDATTLLAGDIWDDGHAVTAAQLNRLRYAVKRPTTYVLGNHDAGQDWCQLIPLMFGVGGRGRARGDADVVGVDYADAFDPAAGVHPDVSPPRAVALFHQHWREWHKRGRVALRYLPPYALSVCGDVHVTACLRDEASPTDRYWVSPGPLVPQDVSETDHGRVYVVEVSAGPAGPLLLGPPELVELPNRRAYLRLPVAPDPEEALGRAAVAALDSQLNDKPPPAVVYEGAERYPGFRETARTAAARCHYLVGFRPAPPPAADPEALARVRARHGARLPDVVGDWPGLRDGDRALARRLADPRADPAALLAAARPADDPDPPEAPADAPVPAADQHPPPRGPRVGPGGADGGPLGAQRLG